MKQKIFASAFFIIFCLTGCTARENQSYIQNKNTAYYDIGYNVYENGLLYSDGQNRACFLDYKTMNGVPLCNKPNCTHRDNSCISKLCLNSSPLTFVYRDYLYWFSSDFKIVNSKDGKSQSAEIRTQCMRSALSTGEAEVFAEIDGVFMNHQIDLAVADDTLYIIGSRELSQNEDGTWGGFSRSREQYLYAMNLNSAEVKNYGQINNSPYAENNWAHGASIYSEVEIDGIYNDRLYMHYRYVKDPQIIIDFINDTEKNEIPWLYENKYLDLKTGEINISEFPYAQWIQDNTYIYEKDKVFFIMDGEGNSISAGNIYENEYNDFTFVNGKLWKCSIGSGFNPKTGEEFIIEDKYFHSGAMVMDFANGVYIVKYYDNGSLAFDFVLEENLIK